MREHSVNSLNNFIMGWYSDNTVFCDELINYHNLPSTLKGSGPVAYGIVNTDQKDSIDSTYRPEMLETFEYKNILKTCLDLYTTKYNESLGAGGYSVQEGFNIQHYKAGGGFKSWHTERCSGDTPMVKRHLVWMTYLNDVNEKGGTEFMYQNITIRAEKGLTLIWPADWTFTHRGVVSEAEEKYIVTGWVHLNSREDYENCNLLRRPS
jgi:hypothetical protein